MEIAACHRPRTWTPWPQSPPTSPAWTAAPACPSEWTQSVETAISGWRKVGTSTEPGGDNTLGRDASIFSRMTCQEAQTGQQWGEGSRTTSAGLPRGSTWTQPPKLWFLPCLKKKTCQWVWNVWPRAAAPPRFLPVTLLYCPLHPGVHGPATAGARDALAD